MVDINQSLDFERPVIEVENELLRLRALVEGGDLSQAAEVKKLERKLEKIRTDVYGSLSAFHRVLLSRHSERPFTLDYVDRLVTDFKELKGDRLFGDDAAIIGGLGRFEGKSVVVVGHQ